MQIVRQPRHNWLFHLPLLGAIMFAGLLVNDRRIRTTEGADGESSNIVTNVGTGYKFDRQTVATPVHRSNVTAADSNNIATFTAAVTEFDVGGRRNLPVSVRFTNAAQSVTIRYVAYYRDKPTAAGSAFMKDMTDTVTLTATSVTDADGRYVAPTWVFDSLGASHGRIQVTSPPGAGGAYVHLGSF